MRGAASSDFCRGIHLRKCEKVRMCASECVRVRVCAVRACPKGSWKLVKRFDAPHTKQLESD